MNSCPNSRTTSYASFAIGRCSRTWRAMRKKDLRSYQERAASFLYEHDAAFLIAPLGAGKGAAALLKVVGRFKTRWGLTGTPRPNSAMDLFMPAAIITDGALWGRAFFPWRKRYFRPRDPFGREWTPLPGAEDEIAADFGTVA